MKPGLHSWGRLPPHVLWGVLQRNLRRILDASLWAASPPDQWLSSTTLELMAEAAAGAAR